MEQQGRGKAGRVNDGRYSGLGDGGGRGTGLQQYGRGRPVASGGRGFLGDGDRGGGQHGGRHGRATYRGCVGGWQAVSPAVAHGRGQPSVAPAPARGPADGGSGNGGRGRGVSVTTSVYYADLLAYRGGLYSEAMPFQSPSASASSRASSSSFSACSDIFSFRELHVDVENVIYFV